MKTRVKYSKELGLLKYALYKKTYSRINRAIKLGFHIEAIALTESLICDQLESILEAKTSIDVDVSTIGKLLNRLAPYDALPKELEEEIRAWNKERALAIHQFPKVVSIEDVSWNKRIAFARISAKSGIKILNKIKKSKSNQRSIK